MSQRVPFPTGTDFKNGVDQIAANPALQRLARVGFAAKGFMFVVVGVLAMRAAFGLGGETTDGRGAMRSLIDEPFGGLMVGALCLGFAAFALWRFIETLAMPIRPSHRAADVAKHFGSLLTGLVYASLSVAAFDLIQGRGASEEGPQGFVGQVLAQPFGQGLVIVASIGAIAFGAYQVFYGLKERFLRKLETSAMSARELGWARLLGKCGLTALGIVLIIVGGFLFRAGLASQASRAKGLDEVFGYLEAFPGGSVLVALMGLGLLCYGLLCFFDARYGILLEA